jgi:hypothetical protein
MQTIIYASFSFSRLEMEASTSVCTDFESLIFDYLMKIDTSIEINKYGTVFLDEFRGFTMDEK